MLSVKGESLNAMPENWDILIYLDFLVFLYVFWCAEPENDLSFFVVSAVFT